MHTYIDITIYTPTYIHAFYPSLPLSTPLYTKPIKPSLSTLHNLFNPQMIHEGGGDLTKDDWGTILSYPTYKLNINVSASAHLSRIFIVSDILNADIFAYLGSR
jgi:hypothetical protein